MDGNRVFTRGCGAGARVRQVVGARALVLPVSTVGREDGGREGESGWAMVGAHAKWWPRAMGGGGHGRACALFWTGCDEDVKGGRAWASVHSTRRFVVMSRPWCSKSLALKSRARGGYTLHVSAQSSTVRW